MVRIAAFAVAACFGGAVIGVLASNVGVGRRELLVSGDADAVVLSLVVGVGIGAILFGLHWSVNATQAQSLTMVLRRGPAHALLLGCMLIGVAAGLLMTYLWSWDITVGHTNPIALDAAPEPWDSAQWIAYLAVPVVQVLLAVAGIVLTIAGARGVARDRAELVRAERLRRGAGARLDGRVVTAEPAGVDGSRIVARVGSAGDEHEVVAVVEGTERRWMPGARAQLLTSATAPDDPVEAILAVRTSWRSQWLFVQAITPVGA